MGYTSETLMQMLRDERAWAQRVFGKITEGLLDWEIPNTPYTVSWLLWHLGESHHWMNKAILQMKKDDDVPIGYPPWKKGEKTLQEHLDEYIRQNKDLEMTVGKITDERLNTEQMYVSMWGELTLPVGQIISNGIFHLIGHMNVISFANGLQRRMQGEKQKWPPY